MLSFELEETMTHKFTVMIEKEENWYVAKCLENNVASQGKTMDEALLNLKEAVELYYEDNKSEVEEKQIFITTLEVAV